MDEIRDGAQVEFQISGESMSATEKLHHLMRIVRSMKEEPKIGEVAFQIFKTPDHVTLVIDAYEPGERAITISTESFSILCDRMERLSDKNDGHELMSFELYEADLPENDLPDEED
jgi:hypothetical protein